MIFLTFQWFLHISTDIILSREQKKREREKILGKEFFGKLLLFYALFSFFTLKVIHRVLRANLHFFTDFLNLL